MFVKRYLIKNLDAERQAQTVWSHVLTRRQKTIIIAHTMTNPVTAPVKCHAGHHNKIYLSYRRLTPPHRLPDPPSAGNKFIGMYENWALAPPCMSSTS